MFDIGWTELVVIGVVALLVIGPRELPQVLRTIGQWVGKARAMAREFHSGVSDMMRESELDELKKSAESAVRQFEGEVKSIDPSAEVEKSFNFDAPAAPGTPPASPADPDAPPAVAAAPPAPDPAKT
jgi:sec-independent protein translocase protein TatB